MEQKLYPFDLKLELLVGEEAEVNKAKAKGLKNVVTEQELSEFRRELTAAKDAECDEFKNYDYVIGLPQEELDEKLSPLNLRVNLSEEEIQNILERLGKEISWRNTVSNEMADKFFSLLNYWFNYQEGNIELLSNPTERQYLNLPEYNVKLTPAVIMLLKKALYFWFEHHDHYTLRRPVVYKNF